LGLLLGVAEVYNTWQEGQRDNMTIDENITANVTQSSDSGSKAEETGK